MGESVDVMPTGEVSNYIRHGDKVHRPQRESIEMIGTAPHTRPEVVLPELDRRYTTIQLYLSPREIQDSARTTNHI